MRVTFYTRPGCRLCDEAKRALQRAVPTVAIEEVDVDSSPDLKSRYGFEIPVAEADGQELFRHRFDPACVQTLCGLSGAACEGDE